MDFLPSGLTHIHRYGCLDGSLGCHGVSLPRYRCLSLRTTEEIWHFIRAPVLWKNVTLERCWLQFQALRTQASELLSHIQNQPPVLMLILNRSRSPDRSNGRLNARNFVSDNSGIMVLRPSQTNAVIGVCQCSRNLGNL